MPKKPRLSRAPSEDDFLQISEVAAIRGVHPTTISRRIKSGDLPAYRLKGGHAIRVRRGDVGAAWERVTPDVS